MPLHERLGRFAMAALAAGLLLAGCEAVEQTAGPGTMTADGEPPPPPPPAPFNPGGDYAPGQSIPYSGMAALPPGAEDPLPPVDDDPQQLMGLDGDALDQRLGKPMLVRRDGDAEVWQYRADRCVLDLFLYGTVKKVEHVDLRNRGEGDEAAVRNCFADMLRAAMAGS